MDATWMREREGSCIVIERHVAVRHWARKRTYNNGIIPNREISVANWKQVDFGDLARRFMGLVIVDLSSSSLTIMENRPPPPDSFPAPPRPAKSCQSTSVQRFFHPTGRQLLNVNFTSISDPSNRFSPFLRTIFDSNDKRRRKFNAGIEPVKRNRGSRNEKLVEKVSVFERSMNILTRL